MDPIDVSDAAAVFEGLVKRAAAGEEIVTSRDGRPVARLAPLTDLAKPRIFGRMRGKIRIADDFYAPLLDDVVALFEHGSVFPDP